MRSGGHPHSGTALAAGALALTTVGLQIAYPPASATTRTTLSVMTVLVFTAASVTDAARCGGVRTAAALLGAGAGIGGLAEIVGVHTGRPFGEYAYTGSLGPQVFGVPLVVPLAWTMAAWPAWRVAGLLSTGRTGRRGRTGSTARVGRWLAGSWALASWDLFLDPQMVAGHHWVWAHPAPSLPGIGGIPASNFLGWLGVSVLVVGALELSLGARLPPGGGRSTHTTADPTADPAAGPAGEPTTGPAFGPAFGPAVGPAIGLLAGWTWVGGVLANAFFFHRPGVAVVGGLAMGLVAVPVLRSRLRRRGAVATGVGSRLRRVLG